MISTADAECLVGGQAGLGTVNERSKHLFTYFSDEVTGGCTLLDPIEVGPAREHNHATANLSGSDSGGGALAVGWIAADACRTYPKGKFAQCCQTAPFAPSPWLWSLCAKDRRFCESRVLLLVRPAWAHSCGYKSHRKRITANEAKRNCVAGAQPRWLPPMPISAAPDAVPVAPN